MIGFNSTKMKLSEKWYGSSLGPIAMPPPPPPKNVQEARRILEHVEDWANIGNKELERECWKLLSEYANKQAERPIITKT